MKKTTVVRVIWLFLFLSFLALYYTQAPEYLESQLKENVMVTEELAKQFEEDVKNGKEIDVNDYIKPLEKYNNTVSDVSFSISRGIENVITEGLESLFSSIGNTVKN